MSELTNGNRDNLTEAIHGLDIFTKNWCMNCDKTGNSKDLVFRCDECLFVYEKNKCLIKMFAHCHESNYPLNQFGSMGQIQKGLIFHGVSELWRKIKSR